MSIIRTDQEIEAALLALRGNAASVIRIGDGEGRVLCGVPDAATFVFERQFGHNVTPKQSERIADSLRTALRGASMIGYRPSAVKPYTVGEHVTTGYWRRAAHVAMESGKPVFDMDFFYRAVSTGFYHRLLDGASRVVLVSGRDVSARIAAVFGVRVAQIAVPPEAKFSTELPAIRHYPDRFEEVRLELRASIAPGDIVLVGAGVLGKTYANEARACGATAYDIGAVFDVWAGLRTRGAGRGRGVENLEFKL